MAGNRMGADEYQAAATSFVASYGLLVAGLLVNMPWQDVVSVNVLLVVGGLSLLVAGTDLLIKYRRLQKGITTEQLIRQVETDIRTGEHPLVEPTKRLPLILLSGLAAGVAYLASKILV